MAFSWSCFWSSRRCISATQCLVAVSIIPAAQVQAMATIKTAPVKANWAAVPQIPSGRANNKARPTAMPPAWAVETRRALNERAAGPDHEQCDQDDPGPKERVRSGDEQHYGHAQSQEKATCPTSHRYEHSGGPMCMFSRRVPRTPGR